MRLFRYKILEWLWTIKYFLISSPLVKRWRLARLLAHNEAVFQYRVGAPPETGLPLPGAVVLVGDAEMRALDQQEEAERKEVIEEYE